MKDPFFATLAIAAGTALIAAAWQSPEPSQPVVDWIRSHAVPLTTPEAAHGFEDMQPLKKIVGDARVVELGEATHGSREFFQMKHRMLEFLATEMGFSIFSIEANMPEAYRLNEYVLTGKGDPKALLRGMYFWTWDTEEVLAMIEWMRAFNQSGKGHVEFTGFDMQTPTVAAGIVEQFVAQQDPQYATTLREAVRMTTLPTASQGFGVATGRFPVAEAGRRIRFSGYIRTEGITRGYAGLWWRVDGQSGVLAFDNMQNRGVTGTTDWKKYEIDLPVAENATNINFGALHPGDGTAWFDNLTIEVDGKKWEGSGIDLDFESAPPGGFYLGGAGYEVRPDREIFEFGKQSLRMKYLGAPPEAVDPKAVVMVWERVLSHLEGARDSWVAKGAAAKDVEWAIQNARVVLQCVQMRANVVQRDDSMAANIQWILKQSPDAKMVVWAHNGHVTTGSYGQMNPMGSSLRKALGKQMVVFGFAFNQGSFQSTEPGKGLRSFTLTPAPPDSLDATFAAANIPLFALDLRQTPESGVVADWFAQSHRARSIGAVYTEANAAQYFLPLEAKKSYDAMFFVEKTTTARANPR